MFGRIIVIAAILMKQAIEKELLNVLDVISISCSSSSSSSSSG